MNDRHNKVLLDCRLSGQVPDSAWNEHLKDPEFAKFVASEMGVAKSEPTTGARDGAAEKYVLWSPRSVTPRDVSLERAAFIAGWNARKQVDYELALGIKR